MNLGKIMEYFCQTTWSFIKKKAVSSIDLLRSCYSSAVLLLKSNQKKKFIAAFIVVPIIIQFIISYIYISIIS